MSKSSRRWLQEHNDDVYTLLARRQGFRSRAVYKLKEIDEKYQLIRPGMNIIELGSAPGGWSQYIAQKLEGKGRIVATDLLKMEAVPDVQFIQGDFRESLVEEQIINALGVSHADLVISDMAPNMSGMKTVDIPRSLYLVELSQALAKKTLKKGGSFLSKVFQGTGYDEFLRQLRKEYQKVMVRKPKASKAKSREVYILALSFMA